MSRASDKLRHRCTHERCDTGPLDRTARVAGPHRWCRICRMLERVRKGAYRARVAHAAAKQP